ncbi:hypothetical protein FQA39_LY02090 [Lamprigera yunnana]|nr:hypothetical protein FQA39_LY02090 [Lamprigera yunnana]
MEELLRDVRDKLNKLEDNGPKTEEREMRVEQKLDTIHSETMNLKRENQESERENAQLNSGVPPAELDRVWDSNLGYAGPPAGLEPPDTKQAAWTEAPGALVEQYFNSSQRDQFRDKPKGLSAGTNCRGGETAKISLINAQNEDENHNGGNHDLKFNSKVTNLNLEDGYNGGVKNGYSQNFNGGKYDMVNHDKNHHLDRIDYADHNFNRNEGGSLSNTNTQMENKKGHHNSGFHNSYHKDESSNKSSFYDDNDEEGGRLAHISKNGAYGNANAFKDGVSRFDDSYRLRGNHAGGRYDAGRNYQENLGNNKQYNNEDFYADKENFNKIRGGNRHGLSNDRYQESFYQRNPHYQHPYLFKPHYDSRPLNYNHKTLFNDYSHPGKKTITVYEDPRVYHHSAAYSTYNKPQFVDDGVELDVVPPRNAPRSSYHSFYKPDYAYDY